MTTTSVRGLVRDPSGAAIPGAALKLVDASTQVERTTQSNVEGVYIFANLPSGTYNLTVTAQGFQTAAYNGVVVDTGRNTDLNVEMKIGATTETVEVVATAVQLETTSNTIGTTVTNNNIQNLPYSSRDALGFARLSAGASGSGGSTTFNNLPNASLNISLDGMNNNSQRFKSGGTSFFQFAPARIDAVEQVTISTTGLGAEAGGEGAMQIRFVTKRGTDQYKFRILHQFHNEALNANSYFNDLRGIEKPKTRLNYFVGSVGGPLAPFSSYLKNKLFFFAYFEMQPDPRSSNVSTNLLTSDAQAGNFTYKGTDGVERTVNLLQLAGSAGFRSTIDPTVKGILDSFNATKTHATGWEPDPANLWRETMLWRYSFENRYMFPTARVDYQITPSINWHGTWNYRKQTDYNYGGGVFPYYPGTQYSGIYIPTYTYVAANNVDWTISPSMLNNFIFGIQSNRENFYVGSDIHQWSIYGDRRLNLPLVSPLIRDLTPWNRNNPVYELTDTLTMVKGKHTATFGGKFHNTSFYEQSWGSAGVLTYSFGASSSQDPVNNVIRNGLPKVSQTNSDIGNALSLYSLLTGRLTSISGSQNVDENSHKYERFSPLMQRFAISTGAVYAQDSWRVRPNLTLNFGLRMQFDGVIHNTNGIDTWPTPGSLYGPSNGPFQPGVLNGFTNVKLQITKYPYKGDFLNPAPNFGFSWNPQAGEDGILGKLLGGNKTVIGGSYNINFYNEGMNSISNLLCCNGGTTQSIRASAPNQFEYGTLFLDSPLPQFAITPSEFRQEIPASEYVLNGGTSYMYANPNLRSPYVQNWNFRIQRELGRGLVVEARYVGNRSLHMWRYQNIQEINILENGFLNEFIQAQKNLAINQAAGVNSFQNRNLPGQAPLPIMETMFGKNGTNAALSTGSTWTSSSFIQSLQQGNVGSLANTFASTTSTTYFCRLVGNKFPGCAERGFTDATPYPINFFKANPYLTNASIQDNNGNNNYNGLQIEVRKALSHGLVLNANYTWSKALGDMRNYNNQTAQVQLPTLRDRHVDYGPSPFDRRHRFTIYWEYDLPFGRGRWLGTDNRILDRVIANWKLAGTQEIQTGGPSFFTGGRYTFNQWADGGVVFGGGLTPDDLIKRLSTPISGYDPSCQCFHTDVEQYRMANGAVDPKYFRPGDTPGVIGARIWYYGQTTYGVSLALSKNIRFTERVSMGIKLAGDNVLNHPFLGRGNSTITGTTFGNLTSASGARSMYLRSYIDF
jgi:hypothetical protein